MKEIYDFVDSYVKLTYIVRRLNAKLNRLPDFMFSSGVDCNYREFGLDASIVCKLEGEATIQELNECYKVLSDKVDAMSSEVYRTIYVLSPELREDLYDYLLAKSCNLTLEAGVMQNEYLKTVGQIEIANQAGDADKIRSLGKIAKTQYSKYYELDSFKDTYTYLGCYMSSLVGRRFAEDLKSESGLNL